MTVKAYCAHAADKPLEALDIVRRAPGEHDVQIEIAYARMSRSDLKYRFVIDSASLAAT